MFDLPQLTMPSEIGYVSRLADCVECGKPMPWFEATRLQFRCHACTTAAMDVKVQRRMTRERYRQLWREIRHGRNSRPIPISLLPLREQNVYRDMQSAYAYHKTDGYAKSFKAHETLKFIAEVKPQIESGELGDCGVNGWRIELVDGKVKYWRDAA